MERKFTEQELVRRGKLEKFKELNMDPFGDAFERDSFAAEIKEKFESIPHDDFESREDVINEIYQSKDVMEGHVFPYLKRIME